MTMAINYSIGLNGQPSIQSLSSFYIQKSWLIIEALWYCVIKTWPLSHTQSTWYFTTTMRTWLWALSISEIFDGNNKRFIYQLFISDCDCIIIWCLVFVRAHNWLVHFNRFVAHFGTCHPSRLLCRVTGRNQRIALFQRLI